MNEPVRRAPSLGRTGENLARIFLENRGWRILKTNYRCAEGEIDLIAEEPDKGGSTLVFIEVKTRKGVAHGAPIESVDARKRAKLIAVARAYIGERSQGGEEPSCRFDVVEVRMLPGGLASIDLLKGAFTQE